MRTLTIFAALLLPVTVRADETIDFNRDVRPILSNACFQCHGPDASTREAGLRLDDRESAVAELDSGEITIVPGDPDAGELIRRVTSDDEDLRMPPEGHGDPLSAEQVSILRRWINAGAVYQRHWAFQAPGAVTPPATRDSSWPKNDIDQFVLARLEAEGRMPSREAGRETLIRRVAFDLTGLPPTLEEVDRFLSDDSPRAYERMVDRYFASDAYGEQMARHWLDLARYADSNGYQYDTEREQWVWRDWVIDAYNRNVPFDQFTVEQIAGDLLPDATDQQRLATGFNRNHGITIEGGIIDEEYRVEYVMDRLVTVGNVWMGMTLGCARCHDHKYDPISQKEFYQLYAFFNQVPERGMRGFTPSEKIQSPLADSGAAELAKQIADVRMRLGETEDVDGELAEWVKSLRDNATWEVLKPVEMKSTGGSTLTALEDDSILAGQANPQKDIYEITAECESQDLTAVRLQCLTHPSLPGGGPGRHSNSNFVLSEIELTAVSVEDPSQSETIKFREAKADYSQKNYGVANAIDGTVAGNNGWAVDGPSRKEPATALLIAEKPFGFEGGTRLQFRLRHEAGFATHGIGRARLSVTRLDPGRVSLDVIPEDILLIAHKPVDSRSEGEQGKLRDYYASNHGPKQKLIRRLADLEKQQAELYPATMIMQDMPAGRDTFVLNRGQYNEPTEQVSANVPEVFGEMNPDAPRNRLGFARWLTGSQNPLTARVVVNRYWERLFGVGLVKTSEDFGIQGELPSHPMLLDWLSREFVRRDWNVKETIKLIMMSATYRQTSHAGEAAYAQDPENRWLARGPRMRLSAEEIRDNALAVSGLLVKRTGGKSVYPYQPDGLWMELNNRPGYSKKYPVGSGDDLYRRSIYTFWKRTVPPPMLKTLDAPTREFCTVQRSRTNTPLQSLLLLNGPQFVEAARHLGRRMIAADGDVDGKIRYGFRLITARTPTAEELALIRVVYRQQLQRFTDDPEAARRLLNVGASENEDDSGVATLAAWAGVGRLLLNLDETITKN